MWMLIFITFLQTPVMKDLAPGCVQGFNNVRQCHKKVDVLTAPPPPLPQPPLERLVVLNVTLNRGSQLHSRTACQQAAPPPVDNRGSESGATRASLTKRLTETSASWVFNVYLLEFSEGPYC